MRTLVDIPEEDLKALDELRRQRKVSRSKLIRSAIGDFLHRNATADEDQAFGLWGGRAGDGLDYQRRVRAEW